MTLYRFMERRLKVTKKSNCFSSGDFFSKIENKGMEVFNVLVTCPISDSQELERVLRYFYAQLMNT